MQLNLAGKAALVTGSSRGIGLAIAEALHGEGCRVALNSRNPEELASVAERLPGAIAVAGDVTESTEAQRVVSEVLKSFGKLDVVVCNVGSGQSVPPGEETPEEWQRVFGLNLWSATNTVAAARDALADSMGAVVCISSICGLEVIASAPITYSAAKAALHAYVRGMARPLGKQGVRINAIASGNILFDDSVWSRKLCENSAVVQTMLERDVALGRLGTPQDVASLVVYLASVRTSFVTGGIWTLDGGQVHS
jgi:NAD(P)-dependent dehydrogenase (short-subunit alcohol dehydrogenase family)